MKFKAFVTELSQVNGSIKATMEAPKNGMRLDLSFSNTADPLVNTLIEAAKSLTFVLIEIGEPA
jgi:hypothetical protein